MATIKTSKTEEVTYDGQVLKTPMNALAISLGISSYCLEDSTSVYSAKTQEPLIDLIKRGEVLPNELVTFSGGRLTKSYLLDVKDLDDHMIMVTVLDKLESADKKTTERFIGYLIYKI